MKAVIQRIAEAKVVVDQEIIATARTGLMVLVGFSQEDLVSKEKTMAYMADKLLNIRLFEDKEGKMNLSLVDISGDLLLVPNFTLYADCRKGRRPSFVQSAGADEARGMFESFVGLLKGAYPKVSSGIFQADMKVHLINDGPVTVIVDSPI